MKSRAPRRLLKAAIAQAHATRKKQLGLGSHLRGLYLVARDPRHRQERHAQELMREEGLGKVGRRDSCSHHNP